ncbi:hypothetical protein [Idiomarina piscisalsi]|uniref:HMW1C N-terminal domain-containing protein n=1 Tax=Idiomarina piscisalsi TaxID=1096243 RepID=A0A432YHL1_9GAMM|nr:hypothetical protein [Idiomarina piscisalsi]RUO60426.1 hypothetical protein CWI73_11715 [Idiomarina piscisalsi]
MKADTLEDIVRYYEQHYGNGQQDVHELTFEMLEAVRLITQRDGGVRERQTENWKVSHWYTRLASALTLHFLSNQPKLEFNYIFQLAYYRTVILNIFAASGYRGAQHLFEIVASPNEEGRVSLDKDKAIIIHLVTQLDDVRPEMIDFFAQGDADVFFILGILWLAEIAVVTPQGEENRNKLLGYHEKFLNVSDQMNIGQLMTPVENAWMYCSYANIPEKHELKRTLNSIIKRFFRAQGVAPRRVTYKKTKHQQKKPRMLVIMELFTSGHAMFRCYAKLIAQMSEHFELYGLTSDDQIDEDNSKLFRKILSFEKGNCSVNDMVKIAQSLNPDVIYYPSLGMVEWSLILANFRLAPIQVSGAGHPATTQIPTIDYFFAPSPEGGYGKDFSETLVLERSSLDHTLPKVSEKKLRRLIADRLKRRKCGAQIKIAINATAMKLNSSFLDICKKIEKEMGRNCEFHFFPLFGASLFDAISQKLINRLDSAVVHRPKPYEQFLETLAECDISLAPFPFGNSNSTVDAMCLGIPVICFLGDGIASQTDARTLRFAGAPLKNLVSHSESDYYRNAIALIQDSEQLSIITDELLRIDFYSILKTAKGAGKSVTYAELMNYVYSHHEELQAKQLTEITYKDL